MILLVPHAVSAVFLKAKTQLLSASWATVYELVLRAAPNVTTQQCQALNPASPLPIVDDREPHNCEEVVSNVC